MSVEAKAKYIALCRKLEQDERREEEGEDILDRHSEQQTEARKPLPDYAQLQRDVKKQQLKVGKCIMNRNLGLSFDFTVAHAALHLQELLYSRALQSVGWDPKLGRMCLFIGSPRHKQIYE